MSFAPPPPPAPPPAGWYPDPERPGGPLRWWNGAAWDAAWVPTTGDPDALPEIGAWLSRSFAQMWRRWRALFGIGLVTAVPAGVLVSLAIRHLFRDVLIIDDELVGWDADRLWVTGSLGVVASLLGAIATLAASWLMLRNHDANRNHDHGHDHHHDHHHHHHHHHDHDAGEATPPTAGAEVGAAARALGAALASLPRAIMWWLLLMIGGAVAASVLVVLFVVAWPLGLLAVLACFPLAFWLMVRWAFVNQALVDRPGNPFRRSTVVSAGRFWAVCGRILLVVLIIYGMSAAGNLAASAASGFGGAFSTIDVDEDVFDLGAAVSPSILGIVVTALVAAASAVFVTGTFAAAFAELYRTRNPAD